MDKKKLRTLINNLHLWMGLGSGIILFVVCLSGTIYTFRSEIERWIDSEKFYADVPAAGTMLSADELIITIEKESGVKVNAITVPSDKSMNWQLSLQNPDKNKGGRGKTIFVNPYTAKTEGEQGGQTSEFFTKVMQLHRWLLMEDSIGRIIVGIATIIFVFIIISGLILWFPSKLRLIKQGLTIKTSANWKRINHDLHNTLGFYSFILLLIMALTGLCWSFEWYRDGLSSVLGAKVFKGRNEKPISLVIPADTNKRATYASLLASANELFNYEGNSRLSIPESDSSAITITKTATGFFAVAGPDKAQFDRFSGEMLKAELYGDKALNVQIADSIKILHTGEIFGTFSKIIYFLVCLIATSLPVTGTMIWLNKMKKKTPAPKSKNLKLAAENVKF